MATRYLSTPLTDAYFSEFNREYIHGAIIRSIKAKTGYTIDRQSDADLQALMKRVYVNMVYDDYSDIRTQISNMNAKVVEEAAGFITTGILQQIVYMRDISSNPVPLDAPSSTSTYGNKIPINNRYGIQ